MHPNMYNHQYQQAARNFDGSNPQRPALPMAPGPVHPFQQMMPPLPMMIPPMHNGMPMGFAHPYEMAQRAYMGPAFDPNFILAQQMAPYMHMTGQWPQMMPQIPQMPYPGQPPEFRAELKQETDVKLQPGSIKKEVDKERNQSRDGSSSGRQDDRGRRKPAESGSSGRSSRNDRWPRDERVGRNNQRSARRNEDGSRHRNNDRGGRSRRGSRSPVSARSRRSDSRSPVRGTDSRRNGRSGYSRKRRRSTPPRNNESQRRTESSSGKGKDNDFCFSSDNYSSEDDDGAQLTEEDYRMELASYTRCSPSELYFTEENNEVKGTERLEKIMRDFEDIVLKNAERVRQTLPPVPPKPVRKPHVCMHFKKKPKLPVPSCKRVSKRKPDQADSCESESSCDSDWCSSDEEDKIGEMDYKRNHPFRLHDELWFNEPGELNDGDLCRCSIKARRTGIRHNFYPGEVPPSPPCDPNSNNTGRLFHYRIAMTPKTNFVLNKFPTKIRHDQHDYLFEGFSLFSHYKLPENLPSCRIIRYNIEYLIVYLPEEYPANFTVGGLDMMSNYLFGEVLELVDFNWKTNGQEGGCPQFHLMPRFVRPLPKKGKELLSMNYVLLHLLRTYKPLISKEAIAKLTKLSDNGWVDMVEETIKGHIVTKPGMKPASIRVDQLDRELSLKDHMDFPEIVHFGMRPAIVSFARNPAYQKALLDLTKFKKFLATKARVDYKDKAKLGKKEKLVSKIRQAQELKRDVTVTVSSEGFYRTGFRSDVVQHALMVPVLIGHLRFHQCLHKLEETIKIEFKDRLLLQLALTHPSYRENYGTNPDHLRNVMTNCGMRQPEYGDRRVLYLYSRKRGIKMLLSIMSRLAKDIETASTVHHYERLEFLGDAVIEFLTSIHLFYMFPDIEEGGLATYRAAIVQNQHLSVLAKKLRLDEFMLYAHGSDLCHDLELKHAMANSFEALMGAIFLERGIQEADRVFGETLFDDDPGLLSRWRNYSHHPLQLQEPDGDRHWVEHYPILQKLAKLEESIGVQFKHIRLLARAFTHRSAGFNNLTLGSNQRLEFLGDTVLQLVSSEYLYKFFPEHHEGHLSLLRSSIVNNRTQAVVHDDLGMLEYSLYPTAASGLKVKDRADILEAFLGALFVDKGLKFCQRFCRVVFFPRLEDFIRNQDWNDPKSKLQQCCLTLRHLTSGQPEIPLYKVVDSCGPTNTRQYSVAVYFRGKRMATASGSTIKDAQWKAASKALENYKEFFNHKVVEDIIKGRHDDDHSIDSDDSRSCRSRASVRRNRSSSRSHDRRDRWTNNEPVDTDKSVVETAAPDSSMATCSKT